LKHILAIKSENIVTFAYVMDKLWYFFVWLSRMHRCLGFGIQSPTDFQFVRDVINEHAPYYKYSEVGQSDDWMTRRLGRLYFRIANWLQPSIVFSRHYGEYLHAGCNKCKVVDTVSDDKPQMAIVDNREEMVSLLPLLVDGSVLVVDRLYDHKQMWNCLLDYERATLLFDLYYCGIVIFDSKRIKQHYIVNF
jgi:hypothetical protein